LVKKIISKNIIKISMFVSQKTIYIANRKKL